MERGQTDFNESADQNLGQGQGRSKGRGWQNLLEQTAETAGLTLQAEAKGFKLLNEAGELVREVEFYPRFDWSKLSFRTRLDPTLGLEILNSPGLQRMLVESSSLTALKRLWTKWQRGQAQGYFENVPSFTRYVGLNGYPVSVEQKTLLAQAIPGADQLSPAQLAKAILATTEPKLLALSSSELPGLPERLRTELEKLLEEPNLVASTPYLEEARLPLIARVNGQLGNQIQDLAEFEAVMRVVEQNGSRGALAETVFRRLYAGPLTGSEAYRKPYFPKEMTRLEQAVQPDMLRPLNRSTLDVKVGYRENRVDKKQLERYTQLVVASQNLENVVLRQRLAELDLEEALLVSHDYVFMPDGQNSSREAATRLFNEINKSVLIELVNVFYVERFLPEGNEKEEQEGVFRLILDEDNEEIAAELVGLPLPD